MAGRKRPEIPGSSEELRAALFACRGKSVEHILLLLLHIKENPSQSIREISRHFGLSERTVYRRLQSYQKLGLRGLLAEHGISDPGEQTGEESAQTPAETNGTNGKQEALPPLLNRRTLAFLNRLPVSADTVEWGRTFKRLLCELFDDVDHVALNIRTTLDLINPTTNRPGQVHRQSVFSHRKKEKKISVVHDTEGQRRWEKLYEEGVRNGFPAEDYREPTGFDYYYQTTGSYIGTILLFSRRENPPISPQTITLMEELRPFFLFILSDHIARHRMVHPEDVLFRDLVTRIGDNARLSEREKEILMLLVLAYSYSEIASCLFISVKTVESHVKAIYRKIGVQNLKEVFARYITPRLFPT